MIGTDQFPEVATSKKEEDNDTMTVRPVLIRYIGAHSHSYRPARLNKNEGVAVDIDPYGDSHDHD